VTAGQAAAGKFPMVKDDSFKADPFKLSDILPANSWARKMIVCRTSFADKQVVNIISKAYIEIV
jgi:hypothetical protein